MHLRHVDAGSDGAEEQEIQALLGTVYDIHRLGVFITASPRHADVLLVTGAGARGMTGPLRRTLDGMPDPKLVIAVGTDAVSGGLISPSYATTGGVGDAVVVDTWLPGSPPARSASCTRCCSCLADCPHGGETAMSGVFAAGLILLAAAAAVDLGAGARWPRLMGVPYLLGAAGSGCLAAAARACWSAGRRGWPSAAGFGRARWTRKHRAWSPTGCPPCSC